MGEASDRARRAREYITQAECDLISEASAEAIAKAITPLIHATLMAEVVARARAGEITIVPHRLPVGVESGIMMTLLSIVWGYLPPTATKRDLIDNYRALVPVIAEGLAGPPGQLIAGAMAQARKDMH